ncbi:sigma-70 family RNA polymerase sigma factor [Reichenbachiella sp. MALMAid0571]|uniref:RNA polymerase sigma factor n=1 Tax=Reichenbachiella sp. MALMAid0571 TaxID=3143939 RepID=UPI0032E047B4
MSDQVTSLVDHYFRNEYGNAVSYLTAKFGKQHLELAEDAVQEALFKAMKNWSYSKVPNNPSGWIVTVASNKMIDHLRRATRLEESNATDPEPVVHQEIDLESIQDDVVKMMFACCHPSLSTEHQIILTLKILGGLSVKEIARALLKKEETIAKSYTRAKQKFKNENIQLELPQPVEIKNRLSTVLHIIYLLFNEGYKTTNGNELLKKDLCQEAIRLNGILLENNDCNTSIANALMALMYFHSSRFDARVDKEGYLITLEFQNRSLWNQNYIQKGIEYLEKATKGAFINEFYLQATISGLHCEAKHYDETKWSDILELYDTLTRLNPSPVVKLNRIVALGKAKSPNDALKELKQLETNPQIENHYLYYAIKGEFLIESGSLKEGKQATLKAISLTNNTAEKQYLMKKLEVLSESK